MLRICCIIMLLWLRGMVMQAQPRLFTHMDAFDGLSDNKIQHILQLRDGRMVFTTPKTINLYDGSRFRYFTSRKEYEQNLPAYLGAYHVYNGEGDILWVKDYKTLFCFDIRKEQFVAGLDRVLRHMDNSSLPVVDLFLDSGKTIWLVRADGSIWNTRLKKAYTVPLSAGTLQDLDVINDKGYFFYNTGKVVCISLHSGKVEYVSAAYPSFEASRYNWMSLVVKGPDGNFYQVRNGKSAICLRFDPRTRRWKKLLETPYVLHTLVVPSRDTAYITCGKGLWKLDLRAERNTYEPSVRMVEGSSVVTDINTIFIDNEKGWWLGTSGNGLLYGHMWRDAWNMDGGGYQQLPLKTFRPLLTNVSVNGKILALHNEEDHWLLPQAVPFIRHFEFRSDQNTLAFEFSALNYALPVQTYYRYRLLGGTDTLWHVVTFNPQNKTVDERGILHLPFSRLKTGQYCLQVTAATRPDTVDAPVTEITFSVDAPWWQTVWAYMAYVIIAAACLSGGFTMYVRQRKRRRKEQLLLERIKTLIERCNQYEAEKAQLEGTVKEPETFPAVSSRDNAFLQKAIALVKAHLNSAYSVEDLSRDLCMERTGLYKKLTVLLDQSPSLFIRNIRLQQAARLLREGRQSISDIAAETGFSSSSYFSKCFQEMYGCKPSEYAEKQEKST